MNVSEVSVGRDDLLIVSDFACERGGRTLFGNLSFNVSSGAIVRVDGPNGSGKSTLLRSLCGLFPDWEGSVDWQVSGYPLYVGHKLGVSADLSVEENVAYLLALHDVSTDQQSILDRLTEADLIHQRRRPVRELSEGQRKKVSLCRLGLIESEVWLLDEPFVSLDAETIAWLRGVMTDHCQRGGAIVYTSHQAIEIQGQIVLDLSSLAVG
ncbi:MAG: heme ABC exporter ATP-binding protein CcmA [Pseudomonadota bacterium]